MYTIEGHEFKQADNANRVALYIGSDVYSNSNGGFSRNSIVAECRALAVGESATFKRIPWEGPTGLAIVVVTRS